MGNLQYSFSMHQLEKLEEAHRNIMGKYNTYIKGKYQFDLFDWLIQTQNMFKFDPKHEYYHMNKIVPGIFVENWKR